MILNSKGGTTMNIIDIVVLGIIALMMFKGIKKGLVVTVFEMASFFIAAFCVSVFHSQVSEFLKGTKVFEWVQQFVLKHIVNVNLASVETTASADSANNVMNSLQLPDFLQKLLFNKKEGNLAGLLGLDKVIEGISTSISTFIITILSMIIIFFAVKILLHIAMKILNGIMKLPLFNSANKLAGALFGVINAVFVIYILCAVLAFLAPIQVFKPVIQLINESAVGKVFYNHNILLKIIF